MQARSCDDVRSHSDRGGRSGDGDESKTAIAVWSSGIVVTHRVVGGEAGLSPNEGVLWPNGWRHQSPDGVTTIVSAGRAIGTDVAQAARKPERSQTPSARLGMLISDSWAAQRSSSTAAEGNRVRPEAARFNRSAVCCSVRWVVGQGPQITQGVPPLRFDAPESLRRRPRPRNLRPQGSESRGTCRSHRDGQETKEKNNRLPVLRRRRSPRVDIERGVAAAVCPSSRRPTPQLTCGRIK